jgi:hypothetical protein
VNGKQAPAAKIAKGAQNDAPASGIGMTTPKPVGRAKAHGTSSERPAEPAVEPSDDGETSKVHKHFLSAEEAAERASKPESASEAESASEPTLDALEAAAIAPAKDRPRVRKVEAAEGAEARPAAKPARGASAARRNAAKGDEVGEKEEPSAAEAQAPAASAPAASSGENGALSLNSRPWSQVTIDGKSVGNTPQLNIPLAPGRHKVKLANPELGIVKGFSVEIEAGKTTTRTIEFGE